MALLLSLRSDVEVVDSPQSLVIQSAHKRYIINQPSRGLRLAIRELQSTGLSETNLFELLDPASQSEHLRLIGWLTRFNWQGWLCTTVPGYLTLIPQLSDFCPPSDTFDPIEKRYRLSRFAYLHRENEVFLLETPLAPVQIRLENLSALAVLEDKSPTDSVAEALKLLYDAHMIESGSEPDALRTWEFHDLLFHSRSRQGNHRKLPDRTWRFGTKYVPDPLRPEYPGPKVALVIPGGNQSLDLPFGSVLESRRSVRQYGENPITLDQLGEFLYHVDRIHNIYSDDRVASMSRPFPSGGAVYELELYVVIQNCGGLERGLYHYRPEKHCLSFVSAWNDHSLNLIKSAAFGIGVPEMSEKVQVLIVITARFARLASKYEGIAYAMILKNVGVLYQTMYLVATAMKLAPCALGTGNSRLFSAATDTPYEVESSVGEFVLGSLPDS